MRYQYKSIDPRTAQGIRRAEMLQAHGWKLIQSGFYSWLFEKGIASEREEARMFAAGSEAERVYKEGRY